MPRGAHSALGMAAVCAALATLAGLLGLPAARGAEDAVAPAADPARLLERAFHNLYADDYVQTLTLATRARGGNPLTREMQITRKQSAKPGKALLRFTDPYEVRRTAVLILENDGASDDLYVYLPAVGRTRHLSSSQRADSFFGTDLSYEDIEPKEAGDFEARVAGAGSHESAPCVILEVTARPSFESTYDRMLSCIERERGVIYWTDFYRRGEVVKRLEIDPASVREIGTRHIPFAMTMTTPRRRSETQVLTESYEIRPAIPDTLFSTWNLEAGDAARDRRQAGPGAE